MRGVTRHYIHEYRSSVYLRSAVQLLPHSRLFASHNMQLSICYAISIGDMGTVPPIEIHIEANYLPDSVIQKSFNNFDSSLRK
jgi:hypothetical protein